MDNSNKKKMGKKSKTILIIVTVVLVLIAGIVGGGILYANTMLNKVNRQNISKNPSDIGINSKVFNEDDKNNAANKAIYTIALFGVDAPDGQAGRSDSIMLLTLDGEHQKVKVTSIMRDSYVNIQDHGLDKINHAYAFGGPQLAIKTLNENFDLNIKDFMSVNFSSLPKIIDTMGGVPIDVKDYEVKHIAGIDKPGLYTLTGKQALDYSRIRYSGNGDYERTERQRTVLQKVFEKFSGTSKLDLPKYLGQFLPLVTTNMSNADMLKYGQFFLGLNNKSLIQERFPTDSKGEGKMLDGVYYLTFDREVVKKQVHEYIFNDIKPN